MVYGLRALGCWAGQAMVGSWDILYFPLLGSKRIIFRNIFQRGFMVHVPYNRTYIIVVSGIWPQICMYVYIYIYVCKP